VAERGGFAAEEEPGEGGQAAEGGPETDGPAAEGGPETDAPATDSRDDDAPQVEGKRVTWAELYFDLVFVFAVTQVTGLLHDDHSWPGIGRALIAFVPVYWTWIATCLHTNRQDIENPLDRAGVLAVGLAALFMGLAMPGAFDGRAVLFGAAYWAGRVVLWGLVVRWQDVWFNVFSAGALVTGPLFLAGAFLDTPARTAVWAVAAAVDMTVPLMIVRRLEQRGVHFDPGHLPERFGLFVIVALGESVVAIGAPATAAEHLDAAELAAVAAAFAVSAALWWVYFVYAASALQHAVATSPRQVVIIRQVLSYAHIGFLGGIVAVAVGMREAVAEPGTTLPPGVAGLLYGGCALFLGGFVYTRWRMFRRVSWTRLTAAAVVLAALPLAARLPALGAVALLAGLLVALNAVEWARVRRTSAATA
jgi:low temperature requirement protein LtrA